MPETLVREIQLVIDEYRRGHSHAWLTGNVRGVVYEMWSAYPHDPDVYVVDDNLCVRHTYWSRDFSLLTTLEIMEHSRPVFNFKNDKPAAYVRRQEDINGE